LNVKVLVTLMLVTSLYNITYIGDFMMVTDLKC